MMMLRIAANEFRYMFWSPQTLVGFVFFALMTILIMASDAISIGFGGNVLANSPFAIANIINGLSIFTVFVIPAFVANSLLKDVEYKFDGILFATPISKPDYLFGRFLGSFAALMVALMGLPIGLILGSLWPTIDPETLGPINLGHYFFAFFAFLMPTVLAISAIFYAITIVTRNVMYTYLAAIAFLALNFVALSILTGPDLAEMRAYVNPFVGSAFGLETRYWTAAERNSTMLGYEGAVLVNRLIWLGVAAVFSGLAYLLFNFRKPAKLAKEKKDHLAALNAKLKGQIQIGQYGTPVWKKSTVFQQLMLRIKFEMMSVIKSVPFLIIMLISAIFLLFILLNRSVNAYNLEAFPITRLMIQAVQGGLGLGLIVVMVFYSADIIWRERKDKFHEIMDAVPTPNWVFVVSKLTALMFVLITILSMGLLVSISLQILSGFSDLELGLYFQRGFLSASSGLMLVSILACFVQVLAKNRFVGMMIMVVYLLMSSLLAAFGLEHPLYHFGTGIATPLSDLNGSGRFLESDKWFTIYWSAFSVLLLLATYALWNRGTLQPLKYRLRNLKVFRSAGFAVPAVLAVVTFVGTGSFIFYNTNILNDYATSDDIRDLRVAYEKKYRQYEDLPMPRVIDVKIDVDIYPYKGRVETRSTQLLQNKTDENISTVHLVFPPGLAEIPLLKLEGATQKSFDEQYNYYIFDLETPMVPGERRELQFETLIERRGFTANGPDLTVVQNGTFINNGQIVPTVGFSRAGVLRDRNTRRKQGLEPLPRLPKLEDISQYGNNYISQDSDFINFETTVSTVASQTVVSPGYLEKEWTEGDRRFFTYKMDKPILNFYSYLSAEYEVLRDKYEDIDIEVFHHAPHTYNTGRMIEAVKDSLAYYNRVFSPYQYRQVRILEFPSFRGGFAQAFPNTIPYSEGIGFVADVTDPTAIDLPYYVTAHEMGHQWWAHQVMSANIQGGTMLVETLAQYSALLVMEQKDGKDQIRKFLKFELDAYLRGRATDPEGELPLYRVENQAYIHYRKGAVIMYALKDYVGEDVVNRSLQRLIKERAFKSNPYAISTDLIGYLKEEAGPEYHGLIEDFFEKITLFDVKMTESSVEEMADGRFKVSLDVEVAKFYADAEGAETDAEFDIPVDIGLFLKSPAASGYGADDVIMLEKRRITEAKSTIEIIVDRKPAFAGIDPYNKLIDRNSNDNLHAVVAASDEDEGAAAATGAAAED